MFLILIQFFKRYLVVYIVFIAFFFFVFIFGLIPIAFNSYQYEESLRTIVTYIHEKELEVVAIIADSQSAQTKGIIDYIKSEKGLSSAIYHIPCINHIINLIFAEVISIKEFLPYMKIIDHLIEYCRREENKSEIQDTCPKLVPTRWVYLVDVLMFFKKYKFEIESLLISDDEDIMPAELIDITNILQPLQILSKKCESRSMKLSELLPAISNVTKKLIQIGNSLLSEKSRPIYEFVFKTFIARMLSFPQSILKAAYCVSLPGRSFLRQLEKGYSTKGPVNNGYDNQSQIELDNLSDCIEVELSSPKTNDKVNTEDLQTAKATVDQIADAFLQGNQEQDSQDDDDDIILNKYDNKKLITAIELHQNAQEYFQSTKKRYSEFNKLRSKLNSIKFEALKQINWLTDLIESTKREIINQAHILGYQNAEAIFNLYQSWLYMAHEEPIKYISLDDTNNTYWRRLHQVYPELSHICIRLCSIGVSEAEVERLMSVQKNMFSPHATNVGTEMLHARCVVRLSNNK